MICLELMLRYETKKDIYIDFFDSSTETCYNILYFLIQFTSVQKVPHSGEKNVLGRSKNNTTMRVLPINFCSILM